MKRNWYKFRVKYPKEMDDGKKKKVSEEYLVDAESFTETEKRANKAATDLIGTLTSPLSPVSLCPTSSRAPRMRETIGTRPLLPLSHWMKILGRRSFRLRSSTSMPRTPRKPMSFSASTWRTVKWIGKSSPLPRPRCLVCLNTNKFRNRNI